MYEEVCYDRAFLKDVIVRVDFSSEIKSLATAVPTKLSNVALARFPISEPRKTVAQELQLTGSKLQHTQQEFTEWNYFGREREKRLVIAPPTIYASYARYSTRDVEMIEYAVEDKGNLEVSKIAFPLVVVLTQDCDLEQEHRVRWAGPAVNSQDKWLISVLVAPLYNVEHVYQGEHLSRLDMKMQSINPRRSPGDNLRKNETPRYHYLQFPSDQPIVDSVVDFKHYFSVNGKYLRRLRRDNFVCRLATPYREDLSHRFAAYLARIGLPG